MARAIVSSRNDASCAQPGPSFPPETLRCDGVLLVSSWGRFRRKRQT
jgi:hypothetical protein